jgi:membrane fusion protein, multidrug efflux system
MSSSDAPPRGHRRRRLAGLGALALAAIAAGVVVLSASGSPPRRASGTGVPPGDTTATVTRRTLSESATVDGTLGYGGERSLYDRLAGTFTWLPAVGARIERGGTLFRLDNLPVLLMYGSVPAYRLLKRGVGEGPDVSELNANLIALGYDPYGEITDEDAFSEATAAAVRRWQKADGLPETGQVQLGRVVFAPGAQRVTAVHVSLGQDPPPAQPAAKKPAAKKPAAKKPAATKPAAKKPAAKQPAEKKPAAKEPEESGKEPKSDGENPAAGAGELALTTTSIRQQVQLKVKAEQQQLAHRGERVPVTLPGGNIVHGRITAVGTVASEAKSNPSEEKDGSGGEGESATIAVTVTLDHPVAHLDQAPVSVALVESIRRHVLTVPATALTATAGGGYAVEALEGTRRVPIAVTPGMFAGGYVEVEGVGIHAGLTVLESQ